MKSILPALIFLITTQLNGQPPVEWVEATGSSNFDNVTDFVTDPDGNMYLTGYYNGTMDSDPGPDEQLVSTDGTQNFFVQKLSNAGELVWFYTVSSGSTSNGYGITVDNQGNVYVVGTFQSAADFDAGPSTAYLVALNNSGGFVLKLNASGDFVWVKGLLGSNGSDAQKIVSDGANAIYISGQYAGTMDADPGNNTVNLTSTVGLDIFIVKLTGSGAHVWSGSFGADEYQEIYRLATDNEGNLLAAGNFAGSGDFDPTAGVSNLTTNSSTNGFLIKTSGTGEFIFAQSYGGNTDEEIYDIAVDPSNNILVSGHFNGTVDFDNSNMISNLTSIGYSDIFLLKIAPDASLIWAKSTGSTSTDIHASITTDDAGNFYMSVGYGTFGFDFDFSAGDNNLTASGSGGDAGVSKYDADGNLIWLTGFGGEFSEIPLLIRAFEEDIIYMIGSYDGNAIFSNSPDAQEYPGVGNQDIFALRMSCITYATQTEAACNSYTWPVNGTTYTSSGTYVATIPNTAGCDSIITLNLNLTIVSDLATVSGNTLTAEQDGASYQWITCEGKFTPINNATAQSYTATSNGSYAAQVTLNECVVVTNCIEITGIGLPEKEMKNISIYPNPTSGRLTISTPVHVSILTIEDIQGKIVLLEKPLRMHQQLDLSTLEGGIYFLQVHFADGTIITERLVKEQ